MIVFSPPCAENPYSHLIDTLSESGLKFFNPLKLDDPRYGESKKAPVCLSARTCPAAVQSAALTAFVLLTEGSKLCSVFAACRQAASVHPHPPGGGHAPLRRLLHQRGRRPEHPGLAAAAEPGRGALLTCPSSAAGLHVSVSSSATSSETCQPPPSLRVSQLLSSWTLECLY